MWMAMKIAKHFVTCVAVMGLSTAAIAEPLVNGLGGPAGYGELSQGPNDDGSSNSLPLPFTVNFFGNDYSSFFVNNNGNVTFNAPLGTFTPDAFPNQLQPMIAPFWGDVDTRCGSCCAVYIAAPNPTTAIVTWNNVGFFSENASRTNDFQLILSDRSTVARPGDFDIEFRYNRLQWTTGDASGGVGGLSGPGGTPAQAGYDAGNGNDCFTLLGSRTEEVLDLQNTSNVSLETPGLWRFAIRNGSITTGATADTPLLPTVVTEEGFEFEFDVVLDQRVFIDPLIAIGYDYVVSSGPNIQTVLFPDLGDADGYEVFGYNAVTGLYDILLGIARGNGAFDFGVSYPGGVNRFGVRDIEVTPALDPTDANAFVTGLTFAGAGQVAITQSPVTLFVSDVPEPSTWAMMLSGFGLVGGMLRRRRWPVVAKSGAIR